MLAELGQQIKVMQVGKVQTQLLTPQLVAVAVEQMPLEQTPYLLQRAVEALV
jgi:hypothetical protein